MQLIERGPGNLPVRFLVQIAQRDGVRQQKVELFGHLQSNRFLKFERKGVRHGPVTLNFSGALVNARLCVNPRLTAVPFFSRHIKILLFQMKPVSDSENVFSKLHLWIRSRDPLSSDACISNADEGGRKSDDMRWMLPNRIGCHCFLEDAKAGLGLMGTCPDDAD